MTGDNFKIATTYCDRWSESVHRGQSHRKNNSVLHCQNLGREEYAEIVLASLLITANQLVLGIGSGGMFGNASLAIFFY